MRLPDPSEAMAALAGRRPARQFLRQRLYQAVCGVSFGMRAARRGGGRRIRPASRSSARYLASCRAFEISAARSVRRLRGREPADSSTRADGPAMRASRGARSRSSFRPMSPPCQAHGRRNSAGIACIAASPPPRPRADHPDAAWSVFLDGERAWRSYPSNCAGAPGSAMIAMACCRLALLIADGCYRADVTIQAQILKLLVEYGLGARPR